MMISRNRNIRKTWVVKIQMVDQVGQVDLVVQGEAKVVTIKAATLNKDKETHKSWEWENKSTLTSASASEASETPFQRQSVTSL